MWSGFKALPAYFGGKQKLAGKIISHAEGKVFIDAFLGGGSVSLWAKAKGYKVIANDYAYRSYIAGKALIENNEEKITKEDIQFLMQDVKDNNHFVEENYLKLFLERNATFLDKAFTNLNQIENETKKCLLQLALTKFIFHIRDFSEFGNTRTIRLIREKKYDDVSHYSNKMKTVLFRSNYNNLNKQVGFINKGVFSNGEKNEVYQLDIFEFLKKVKGDTIYFDPPYYGSTDYNDHMNVLDCILEQKIIKPEKSVFNKSDWKKFTSKMFEMSEHIPTWIISFGGPKVKPEEYNELISQFRKTEIITFPYRYSICPTSKAYKNATANEYIIIARR